MPLIPRQVLYGNPERAAAAISPDGERLGYLAPADGVLNVWVGARDGEDFRPVTRDTDRGVRWWAWAHDNRHLIYLQDQGGDEDWHLYSVDLRSGDVTDLTPFDGAQALPVWLSKRRPHDVAVGLNRDNPSVHDLYVVDLDTGKLELLEKNPGFHSLSGPAWVVDDDLHVVGGMRSTPEGAMELCLKPTGPDPSAWPVFEIFDFEDALTSAPIHTTADGKGLYLRSSKDANATRLVLADLATGTRPSSSRTAFTMSPGWSSIPTAVRYSSSRCSATVLTPLSWTGRWKVTWLRSGRCTRVTSASPAGTTPTGSGLRSLWLTTAQSGRTSMTGNPARPVSCS